MNFSFLNPLLDRKKNLDIRIQEAKIALIEAETALANCDDLARTIPVKIQNLRATVVHPSIKSGDWAPLEQSLGGDVPLLNERRAVEALEALQADLPAIRAHWEKRYAQLTA